MKILVTGANGLLGQYVVSAFLNRGHEIRAMVRPAAAIQKLPWLDRVELFRADLRAHPHLLDAFQGVDALVHLAACVIGDEETHFATTVLGTERLLDAMRRSQTRRLVLASSFSIYGWSDIHGTLDENSPIESRIYERGPYAIAKLWQERVTRRIGEANGWDVTILRPGVIWGPGNVDLPLIGQRFGRVRVVIGPRRRLPLTHVENCADCFVKATEDPRAVGETFNVVDDDNVRAWRYAKEYLRRSQSRGIRVPLPYTMCMLTSRLATLCSKLLFHGKGKLPSLLTLRQLAVFKPLRFSNRKLRERLGWQPTWSFERSLERTFDPALMPDSGGPQAVPR